MFVVVSSDGTLYGPFETVDSARDWGNKNEDYLGDWNITDLVETRMKIYVVHEADYDWMPISGVFSSWALAAKYCKAHKIPLYEIEAWELDNPEAEVL